MFNNIFALRFTILVFRITPVKPPGGESHLTLGQEEVVGGDSDEERLSSR